MRQLSERVGDSYEKLALGVACVVQTWFSVSSRLHCVFSGTDSSAEGQQTLIRGHKALHGQTGIAIELTSSGTFHWGNAVRDLNLFLLFALFRFKPLTLHPCAYLFKPFLFLSTEILPACEIDF
jgi:hypothetical protein